MLCSGYLLNTKARIARDNHHRQKLHTLTTLSPKDKEREEVQQCAGRQTKSLWDLKSLPDDDLITLLCATEDEIELRGEFSELKELLMDCTKELL